MVRKRVWLGVIAIIGASCRPETASDGGLDGSAPWNDSLTAFTATKQEVFGFGCTQPSTWSVDLSSREFSYSACVYRNLVTGARTLTADEVARLRGVLENVSVSNRTGCGADAPELFVHFRSSDGGTQVSWADDFYACRSEWGATFVAGLERVFDVLAIFTKAPPTGGPYGRAWPSNAQRVDIKRFPALNTPPCTGHDGGMVASSSWSLDLDSGVIDFAVCYPQENLYVVDSGVLTAAQLDAFNTAANAMVFVPEPIPPCRFEGDLDAFVVFTATGPRSFQQVVDRCPLPFEVFAIEGGSAARSVLEAATHP
ncbi:MAG: hypothetical protein QM817_14950 [Archangium sp.]